MSRLMKAGRFRWEGTISISGIFPRNELVCCGSMSMSAETCWEAEDVSTDAAISLHTCASIAEQQQQNGEQERKRTERKQPCCARLDQRSWRS